ncbi:RyR domain-containing protein [Methanorbis furvi]|uniref:Ryanodine receptor Ryr domain-containing protein n=1 Tax=Methanorbis furvi TaxID=3028299 RepID=A0AAE4MD95_9EURY|nr:hypothetical protein [Methanocorpusculaceae archaeon Ag1]
MNPTTSVSLTLTQKITELCLSLPELIFLIGDDSFILDTAEVFTKLGHFCHPLVIIVFADSPEAVRDKIVARLPILHPDTQKKEQETIRHLTGISDACLPLPAITFKKLTDLTISPIQNTKYAVIIDRNHLDQTKFISSKTSILTEEITDIGETDQTEFIAQAVHSRYAHKHHKPIHWNELTPTQQDQNICQAAHHLIKFAILGYRICPGEDPKKWNQLQQQLTTEGISFLAELEHNRWWAVMLANGWHLNERRDDQQMLHPDMIPYSCLNQEAKQKDIDAFESIQMIYQKTGYHPEKYKPKTNSEN